MTLASEFSEASRQSSGATLLKTQAEDFTSSQDFLRVSGYEKQFRMCKNSGNNVSTVLPENLLQVSFTKQKEITEEATGLMESI